MKNFLLTVLALIGFSGLAQEHVMAQDKMSLEQRTELRVKQITLDLDLNEKQQKELKTLLLADAQKKEARRIDLRENKDKRKELTADERFKMKNEALEDQIAFRKEIKKILTPEQMEKWSAKREAKMERTKKNGVQKKQQDRKGMKKGN
jgi:hypothetical protein